jgi:PhzF family phenazine biosynthesis protein
VVENIFQVDAFAEGPFRGNPACVCILEEAASDAWMQSLAAEMNLSETAFVVPREETFELRWCTPSAEVELCGHATLAAAHVLWESGRRRSWPIRFETRSGELTAWAVGEDISLDFPTDPPRPAEIPPGLGSALGAEPVWFGRGRDYLVAELATEEAVVGLRPDSRRLREIVPVGVCVTARSGRAGRDFVSRFFAPGVGIDEDPVTGSAHCLLGPLWGDRLGKSELVGFQASARGGLVRVRTAGERTVLLGRAVTVFAGTLRLPIVPASAADQGAESQSPGGRK